MVSGVFCDDDVLSLLTYDEDNVAFIKSDGNEEHRVWEIYGADGTKLAALEDRECAFWVAKQND